MIDWQQLVEVAVRPSSGDALKGLGEPGVWIDAVHLGGLQQRCDRCPCPTAAVRSGEQGILAGDGLRPDGALDGIAVDIEAAVMQEAFESLASACGIADRLGEFGLAGNAPQFLFPERAKVR